MTIGYWSSLSTIELLRYFLGIIEPFSENLTKYGKSDLILCRNVFYI